MPPANKTINISINVFTLKTQTHTQQPKLNPRLVKNINNIFMKEIRNKTRFSCRNNDHFAIKYCHEQTGQIFNNNKPFANHFKYY